MLMSLTAFAFGQSPHQTTSNRAVASVRTTNGRPALEGIWNADTLIPLERPTELGMKAFYSEHEAAEFAKKRLQEGNRDRRDGAAEVDLGRSYNDAWLEQGAGFAKTLRTSLVIDPPNGRIPSMIPTARARFEAIRARFTLHPADGPEDRPLSDRCLMFSQSGPPMIPATYNNNYQIVQTHEYIAILAEMGDQVRVIPLDGRPHLPQNIVQWMGDSRGHWEGDTLVVETTNFRFNDRSRFGLRYEDGMTDQNLHVIERFRRTSPDLIIYQATIDDSTVYTKPWTLEVPMEKGKGPVFEYACHEGNYAMVDILSGERMREKKRR
jgi:hypothetical protein